MKLMGSSGKLPYTKVVILINYVKTFFNQLESESPQLHHRYSLLKSVYFIKEKTSWRLSRT